MKTEWTKENSISLATLIVYIAGAVIAAFALCVYIRQTKELNQQNKIQTSMSLRSAENTIYKMKSEDEYLMAFFADLPTQADFSLADAKRCVNLFLSKGNFGGWSNVKELLNKMYEPNDKFHDPKKVRLRKAYDLAERLLYLLQDANSAYRAHILDQQEYETWMAYLEDMGFHPMFLSALYFGHSSGYISKEFAKDIKERLLSSNISRKAVGILYKELLEPDWINQVGKGGYYINIRANSPKISMEIRSAPIAKRSTQ